MNYKRKISFFHRLEKFAVSAGFEFAGVVVNENGRCDQRGNIEIFRRYQSKVVGFGGMKKFTNAGKLGALMLYQVMLEEKIKKGSISINELKKVKNQILDLKARNPSGIFTPEECEHRAKESNFEVIRHLDAERVHDLSELIKSALKLNLFHDAVVFFVCGTSGPESRYFGWPRYGPHTLSLIDRHVNNEPVDDTPSMCKVAYPVLLSCFNSIIHLIDSKVESDS